MATEQFLGSSTLGTRRNHTPIDPSVSSSVLSRSKVGPEDFYNVAASPYLIALYLHVSWEPMRPKILRRVLGPLDA